MGERSWRCATKQGSWSIYRWSGGILEIAPQNAMESNQEHLDHRVWF